MSRRNGKKSNLTIGIFTDKSATYNLAILETLDKLDHATAWQIAKRIAEQQKPIPNKDMETRSRRIYSVIQRKTGRLNDLAGKGYIRETEGLWELTVKGSIALAIKKPDVLTSLENTSKNRVYYEQVTKTINAMPEETLKFPFGISVNTTETKQDLHKIVEQLKNDPHGFPVLIEETKSVLSNGINLDVIDEFTLFSLLFKRKRIKKLLKQQINSVFPTFKMGNV